MGVDDGLFAGSALEEYQVLWIIHEEVFCEDCGAEGVAEDVEVFFPVGVVVGVVCSDASACKHPIKCILWRAAMLATFA